MSDTERLSRRELLRRGVLGTTAMATASIATKAIAEESQPVIAGVIDRVEPPNTVVLRRSDGPSIVTFGSDATFWRDEPARLEDFVPGDEVAVEGNGPSNAFAGSHMTTTARLVETVVDRRDGLRLFTAAGQIEIIPQTELLANHRSKPLEQIGRQDRVIAICRIDPSSSNLIALRLGIA